MSTARPPKPAVPPGLQGRGDFVWDAKSKSWIWQAANSGGGGGSINPLRPPKPGDAWIWNAAQKKWVKPPKPNVPPNAQGKLTWDDNKGWVWQSSQQPGVGINPPPGTNPDPVKVGPTPDPDQKVPPNPPVDPDRRVAKQVFRDLFERMGFTPSMGFSQREIDDLFRAIDSWIEDGIAEGFGGDERMLMMFRTSDATRGVYEKRFPGMKALSARGQAMSEAEYIQEETSYRNVLRGSGLPERFYDSFDDYGRFIAGGVSPNEVADRVFAAKSLVNPRIAAELEEYYGIGEGLAVAFLLGLTDKDGILLEAQAEARGQDEIRNIARNITIGGMAEASGFNMDRARTELLSGTALGQLVDPFNARTAADLQSDFDRARRVANRENVLAGIDREDYTEMDTLQGLFGDDQKRLASERRAKRERARFSGSAGSAQTALGVERNF